jgi:hypothetical protein
MKRTLASSSLACGTGAFGATAGARAGAAQLRRQKFERNRAFELGVLGFLPREIMNEIHSELV